MTPSLDGVYEALDAAHGFVPAGRGPMMARRWLPRRALDETADAVLDAMYDDAEVLSEDLLLSQPSASGLTAFDRLARKPGGHGVAVGCLCRARFRVLRVSMGAEGVTGTDLVTGERLRMLDADLPGVQADMSLFGRVAVLKAGTGVFAGIVTPLNEAALAVALGHAAAGAAAAGGNARWAEAVYIHVVRHGTLDIPGLNRRPEEDEALMDVDAPLYALAAEWAGLGEAGVAGPDLLERTAAVADAESIGEALRGLMLAREMREAEMEEGLGRMLVAQMGMMEGRSRGDAGGPTLDAVAEGLAADVGALFAALRGRVGGLGG